MRSGVAGRDLRDLRDLRLDLRGEDAGELIPGRRCAEGRGHLPCEFPHPVEARIGRHEHHRNAGVAQLQHHVDRADRAIRDHEGRPQREDRLGVDGVAVARDERQLGRLGERRRHVAAHHRVAEAEAEHGRGDRARDVHRHDALGGGDGHLGVAVQVARGDVDGQLLGGRGERRDGSGGQDGGGFAGVGGRVIQQVELRERHERSRRLRAARSCLRAGDEHPATQHRESEAGGSERGRAESGAEHG